MNFHEHLFKSKGWLRDNILTTAFVVSSMRSDHVGDRAKCVQFYQDLLIALEVMRIKRASHSLDLDEASCRAASLLTGSRSAEIVSEAFKNNKNLVVFVAEHSPIACINIREFAEDMAAKHNIEEYIILTTGRHFHCRSQLRVVGKTGTLHLELNAKLKTLKDVQHEYYQH